MSELITLHIAETRLLFNTVVMRGSQEYPWTLVKICGLGGPDQKDKHCD